jgi:hypothetical protein
MDDLGQVYRSEMLFPIFANRLLSPSRPEYEAFLRWGGFDVSNPPDPIAVLGITEGIRQTDFVEVFPCPVPDVQGWYNNKFFLHGVRWVPPIAIELISQLQANTRLALVTEPLNLADRNAVAVFANDGPTKIGYVPRYLAHDVRKLLEACSPEWVEMIVQQVNLDAPLQQRVLCRLRACWPDGFQPCNGDAFLPIPAGVPARCPA